MKVFKFGGASVKDAAAVENVARVIQHFPHQQLVVVISAMGKTTNAMEAIVAAWMKGDGSHQALIDERKAFHHEIMKGLFASNEHPIYKEVDAIFNALTERLSQPASSNYDVEYDQIVSRGEMLSTKIVCAYLQQEGYAAQWFDATTMVRTNDAYREGKVDWDVTKALIQQQMGSCLEDGTARIAITQGFLGHTANGEVTTLGREGSDFTAAICAYCLGAEDVTIWKDVPGVLNADPKWFSNTVKLARISYREAIELSYYGATVIHPKTLKPLQNKKIPLYVKSFVQPEEPGTVIQASMDSDYLIPSFIFKMDQVLISVSPRDFSFIIEQNLSEIFQCFADARVKINLLQNSALSFSASVDNNPQRLPQLIEALKAKYTVLYNDGLELVTIRHYDQSTIDRVTVNKEILVEQKSRHTARMVMRDLG